MIQKIHRLGHQPRQQLHTISNFYKNSRQQLRLSPSFQNKGLEGNSITRNYIISQPNSQQKAVFFPRGYQQQRKIILEHPNSQFLIVNDRKFIKNRTPDKLIEIRFCPQQQNTLKKHQSDPWVKIRLLQNRIIQLHRQNQTELVRLINVNKRIEFQLQNQRKKSANLTKNINFSGEIDTLIKIIMTQKQIQAENVFKQQKQPRLHSLQQKIKQLSILNDQYRQKTKCLQKQLNSLKVQSQMKRNWLIEKQEELQMLTENKMEMEIKILRLIRQKQQLSQKLCKLQNQTHQLSQKLRIIQADNKVVHKQPLNLVKQDNKIKQEKLKKISLRQSYLINEELDSPFLKVNSSIRNKQNNLPDELSEDSLCNIIEKMELLTNTNDKIIIQNQMLHNEINKLIQNNEKLKSTLQLAYERMHLKQLQIDAKIQQNNNLQKSLASLSNINQNTPKSRLDQKNFQLQLSTTTINQGKDCQRCRELVRSLFRLKNQVIPRQKLDKRSYQY